MGACKGLQGAADVDGQLDIIYLLTCKSLLTYLRNY